MWKGLLFVEEEPNDEKIFTKPRFRMVTKEEIIEGMKEMLKDENTPATLESMKDYYED